MKIADDVLAVLSAAKIDDNSLYLPGQLDRKLYERTNKVLEVAGGKWNRKAKAHVFDSDAATRIDQIILTGEVVIPRDEFDFFPTPPDVVAMLLERAQIKPGMTVLEPSAGHGAIAAACKDAGAFVDCVEVNPSNTDHLSFQFRSVTICDFLTIMPSERSPYDRVVMNPPFSKQADVRHVMHASQFLNHGGILVAVMSAGVTFRQNKLAASFRELVESRGGTIDDLPEGSFRESGTMVNTVIVTILA